jgi:hypothetical protein
MRSFVPAGAIFASAGSGLRLDPTLSQWAQGNHEQDLLDKWARRDATGGLAGPACDRPLCMPRAACIPRRQTHRHSRLLLLPVTQPPACWSSTPICALDRLSVMAMAPLIRTRPGDELQFMPNCQSSRAPCVHDDVLQTRPG